MHSYDILVICDPTAAAYHLEAIREQIEDIIKSAGGVITGTENGGLRKLAYPIKGQTSGAYFLFQVKLEPPTLENLRTKIALNKEILRFNLAQGGTLSFQERAVIRQSTKAPILASSIETKTETPIAPPAPAAIQLEELEKKVEQILEQPTI